MEKPGHHENSTIINLQVLRFVAAFLVVYAHAVDLSASGSGMSYLAYGNLENFGAVGVDIFFVISGFIIAKTNLIPGHKSALDFFSGRLIRVVPIYFLFSLPWIPLSIRWHAPLEVWVSTFLFFPAAGEQVVTPALFVGWTLCFEMLFYAGGAIFLATKRRAIAVAVMMIFYAAMWGANAHFNRPVFEFLGNPIIVEFLFGVMIALIGPYISRRIAVAAAVLSVVWFGYTLFAGYGLISESQYTLDSSLSLQRLIYWGIPSVFLVAAAVGLEKPRESSSFKRVLKFLGDASYSVYLVHLTVFYLTGLLLKHINLPSDMIIVWGLVSGVAAGSAAYLWIEVPFMWRLRTVFSGRQQVVRP